VINFLDPRIVGIYVPEVIKGDSYWARVRNFERSFYNHTVIDAVRCIRKKTFIEVDGFDEKLYAGEAFLYQIKALQIQQSEIDNVLKVWRSLAQPVNQSEPRVR
jgi:hypothetical protein